MSTRYGRGRPSQKDSAAAAVVSVAIGAAVGAVTFYLTRLFLTRQDLTPSSLLDLPKSSGAVLPKSSAEAVLPKPEVGTVEAGGSS